MRSARPGKTDWSALAPEFIDQSPGGLSSALRFFSDEAFRFYMPAYLIADLDDKLERVEPVFTLTNGLDDKSQGQVINRRRYGERTWGDYARHRFAVFTTEQASAIVAYLQIMSERDDFARESIQQALANYWTGRSNPD